MNKIMSVRRLDPLPSLLQKAQSTEEERIGSQGKMLLPSLQFETQKV